MRVLDYNGSGKWACTAIQARYSELVSQLGVNQPIILKPKELVHGETRWIYPLMEQVIEGIKAGDQACAVIGVEFIEEDRKFIFGANLKARVARALRYIDMPPSLATRVKRRIVSMLLAGNVPREYREYARLLRKIGFEDWWPRMNSQAPRENKYAMRYFEYFRSVHERSPAVIPSCNKGRAVD